jgi:hypothetical protein
MCELGSREDEENANGNEKKSILAFEKGTEMINLNATDRLYADQCIE